jgi:hypothetical protein
VKPWEKQLEDHRTTREAKAVQSAYDIKPEQAKTLIKHGLSKEILEELLVHAASLKWICVRRAYAANHYVRN